MAAKLVVIYPRPKDIEAFEKVYTKEHVPPPVQKLAGKTINVATKVVGSPQGTPPFYPYRRDSFPEHGGAAKVRSLSGGPGDGGSRSFDFIRRPSDFPGS